MNKDSENKSFKERVATRSLLSAELADLRDEKLYDLISKGRNIHEGVGGRSVHIKLCGENIFVKMIPLTDIEHVKANLYSTKNIFNLPLCYQYGVGSTGFGVWRELASYIQCSNWVVNNSCPNFPLLYHHRIIEIEQGFVDVSKFQSLEKHFINWEHDQKISERYSQLLNSTRLVALFLEYIPFSLHDYIHNLVSSKTTNPEIEISKIKQSLVSTCKFMSKNGFVHFDSHFANIMSDGKNIYISDHGLSLSNKFELSSEEYNFLEEHKHLDLSFALVNLLHSLSTAYLGEDSWRNTLRVMRINNLESLDLPDYVKLIMHEYGSLVLIVDKFYQDMINISKRSVYPSTEIEKYIKLAKLA